MSSPVVTIIVLLLLAVIATVLKQAGGRSNAFPYVRKEALLTRAERSFLGVLDQAVGGDYRIFAQVRLADVVDTKRGLNNSDRQKAFNRIQSKHFDFLLCDKDDFSVICAIELDDRSHQKRKRRDRDAFLDGLCQAVSLPLLHVPAKGAYSVPELKSKIFSTIGQPLEPTFVQGPATSARVEPQLFPSRSAADQSEAEAATEPAIPPCPKCAAPMVLRRATTGSNIGREFWGCSNFPGCRATL
jgi:hypothetical protein